MTTLMDLLPGSIRIGAPDVNGPLAVFPITTQPSALEYVSFAEGAQRGVAVIELPGGASVGDLLVVNPLDVPVLLYEGEELRGAQQDRTVDGAVLVGAGAKTSVPVSCVEQGRWDGTRHAEPMAPSPQAAFPSLRAAKSHQMRASLAMGAEARADQGAVWDAVGAGPMNEHFEESAEPIEALTEAVRRRPGQTGAVVAIDGVFTVADYVSRSDVWAALHRPLVRGYGLDAWRTGDGASPTPPTAADALAWLGAAVAEDAVRSPAPGVGERVRATSGTGLAVGDELVQLSVYAG